MTELLFDIGLKEYTVHGVAGDVTLRFNPADVNFAKEAYKAFDSLGDKHKEYADELDGEKPSPELFAEVEQIDREMRDLIDDLFHDKVADTIFGHVHAYALAGGAPVWENFMMSVIEQLENSVKRERALADARIQKHTGKYHKT